MKSLDYYSELGIARGATDEEIRKAYRKLAAKFHPDVNDSADAEDRFKAIGEAHEVLSDPEKRAKYDRFGANWRYAEDVPPGSGFAPGGFEGFAGMGMDDFLGSIFGGRGSSDGGFQGFGPGTARRSRTVDHEARLPLTLEDAASGGSRQVTLSEPTTGATKTYSVRIPAGIRNGQKLRLAGQGGGQSEGRKGDLFLEVELLPHPRFRLVGRHLHTALRLAPWEAALGATVTLRTLRGQAKVKVPPGSTTGRSMRLRGLGFPAGKNELKEAGDLIVHIEIHVPEELTEEDRKRYEEMQKESRYTPREDERGE